MKSSIKFFIATLLVAVAMVGVSLVGLYMNYGGNIAYKTHRYKAFEVPVSINDFSFYDFSGKEYSIHNFSDKPTLVLFWASWCSYCAKEMPKLDAILESRRLAFNVVALAEPQDTPTTIQKFYRRFAIDHIQSYLIPSTALYQKARIRGIPSFVIVDRAGSIRGSIKPDWSQLDSLDAIVQSF